MSNRVEVRKRRVLINLSSAIVANVLNITVVIWLQQFLLKRISDAEYALYPVVMAVMVLVPLVGLILTGGIARFIVDAYARNDDRRVTEIVSTLMPLLGLAGAVVLTAAGFLIAHVDHVLTVTPTHVRDAQIMLALLFVSTVGRMITAPLGVGLYVRQRFVTINLLMLLGQVLRLLLLFSLLLGVSTRVLWVVVASSCSDVAVMVTTMILSRRAVPALRFRPDAFRWSTGREVISFGAWSFMAHVSGMLQMAANPIILNKLASANALACFHLGNLAFTKLDDVSGVATHTVQPGMTALNARGDRSRLNNAYMRGNRYALWLGCLAAVPLMIFRRELVLAYVGHDYLDAAVVLLLLFAQLPICYPTLLLTRVAEATARIRYFSVFAAVTNIVNVLLCIYLVSAWQLGAIGAAVARLTATVASQPLFIALSLRITRLPLGRWLRETVWLGLAPSLVAAPVWLMARSMMHPEGWFELGLCFGIGALVYGVTLLTFCLHQEERADLILILRRIGLVPGAAGNLPSN